jgi:hypothetical protein
MTESFTASYRDVVEYHLCEVNGKLPHPAVVNRVSEYMEELNLLDQFKWDAPITQILVTHLAGILTTTRARSWRRTE